MSNLESNCKWHFAPQIGGCEDGPNDPMQENFKKQPYSSLIRESIQNSLDVCLDSTKPVRMEFSIGRIKAKEYGNFFELKKHIQGCLEYFPSNNDAKITYQPMIDYLESLGHSEKLFYIKVSDYNTQGMDYVKGDTTKPFYAFVRSAGVSAKKDNTAGGSFGYGKAAYFYISTLRTVFISTQTEDNQYFFEGVSSLCTHKLDDSDSRYVSMGYYDNNNGEPIAELEKIPSRFRRTEPGTDIYILGIDQTTPHDTIFKEMIYATLRNFWLAIYEGKLEITIGDTIITKENLYDVMFEYFDDENDKAARSKEYNPIPYFEAVRNIGIDSKHIYIKEKLPMIGDVRFYGLKVPNATDKVLYMRKPLMLVDARRTQSSNGLYGLFICDDEIGNEYLRKTENPAHNEWKSGNWKECGKTSPKGRTAIKEVQSFVIDVMERIFSNKDRQVQQIQGLEEFLYIPTAVEDDDYESESLIGDSIDQKEEEGNALSTTISDNRGGVNIDKQSIGKVMICDSQVSSLEKDKVGDILSGHGNKKRASKKGGGLTPSDIDSRYSESEDGVDGAFLYEIPVRYRSFAQVEDGKVIHTIIIHSDYEVENGRIDLIVGGDQTDDKVTIRSCSLGGSINGNSISKLHISKGKSVLKICFVDNMKHAVKLDAYELK